MLEIAYPWVLLLLPLPILVYFLLPKRPVYRGDAIRLPFYSQLTKVLGNNAPESLWLNWRLCCLVSIWILLVVGVAKPQWLGDPIELPRVGRDIMLVVDLSGSMQIPDMELNGHAVSRLSMIKSVAGEFIQRRVGDRLGLVLFGTKAYLQTPLTYDRATVKAMLNDATVGLAGGETAIGDGIGLGTKHLLKSPSPHRVLILLTDGVSNTGAVAPLDAATLAAKNNIRIYTIGLGSDRMALSTVFGQEIINPSQDLDEKTLRKIARVSHGQFFRAKDTQSLAQIYASIDELEPVATDKAVFRPITALYHLALLAALFLLSLLILPWSYWYFCMMQRRGRSIEGSLT